MTKREENTRTPATDSGPRPADFPLGSVESRAAVRAMLNRRATQDEKAPTIYRASWVGHPQDQEFEILDINTRLPVNGDTPASGSQSDAVVGEVEERRDAATEAHPMKTGKCEVVRHKEEDDLLILDYEPPACRSLGR